MNSNFSPAKQAVGLLCLLLGLLIASVSQAADSVWARIHYHADDPRLQMLANHQTLSDYGSFQWVQINLSELDVLLQTGSIVSRLDNPFVLTLGGESFDPLDSQLRAGHFAPFSADPRGDFHLVQFNGPIRPQWLVSARHAGLELIQYIHPFTYVVWANEPSLTASWAFESVRWTGTLRPEFRVNPDQQTLSAAEQPVIIAISRHVDQRRISARIRALGGEVIEFLPYTGHLDLVKALLPGDRFLELARAPGVYTLQKAMRMQTRGEMANQSVVGSFGDAPDYPVFPGYSDWLNATGLDGSGVIVSIMDSGVRSTHQDLVSRMLPCVPSASPTTCASPASNHGTHVAGAVAGTGDSGAPLGGFIRGQGVAPGAQLISQVPPSFNGWWGAACADADPVQGEFCLTPDGMLRLFQEAASNGAVLSNNSWGSLGFQYGYDLISQQVDLLVRNSTPDGPLPTPVLPVWSIQNGNGDLNTGSVCDPASLGSPEEAKNLLAVGATRLQNTAGAQVSGSQIFSIGPNSAHGPACDGRVNPDIVAPGWRTDGPLGTSDTAHGFMGGTSMASPVVTGAAALFVQYFRDTFDQRTPSPAMIRAGLTAVARNLHGQQNADGGLITATPSRFQGWGRLDLDAVVNPAQSVLYFDQETVFGSTGESWDLLVEPDDVSQAMRLMLSWTDAPGHGLGGNTPAWVNLLDLRATTKAGIFLGNNIGPDGYSRLGGVPDDRNNLEGVFLQPDQHQGDAVEVTVIAAQVVADALDPWNADPANPRQDFALVCYNCRLAEPRFTLELAPTAVGWCTAKSELETLTVEVTVGVQNDYSGSMTLSVGGEPDGVNSVLSPSEVSAPGTAQWQLTVDDSAAPGIHPLILQAEDGERSVTAELILQLDELLVSAPALNVPADNSADVDLRPELVWTDFPGAMGYQLQVSLDSEFSALILDQRVDLAMLPLALQLDDDTDYFWRVAGLNQCGQGPWSPVWLFRTRTMPRAELSVEQFLLELNQNRSELLELEIANVGSGELDWFIQTDRPSPVHGFDGEFAPDNWALLNTPSGVGGSVELEAGPPAEVRLLGGNVQVAGHTDFQVLVSAGGRLEFEWGYQSSDIGDFDSGGLVINGVFTTLATNASQLPFFDGTQSVEIAAGDLFGFRVATQDGRFGAGILGISALSFERQACQGTLQPADWLKPAPGQGTVPPAEQSSLNILVDPSGLSPGVHRAYLCVSSNDESQAVTAISVELRVRGAGIFQDRFQVPEP